MSFSNFRLILPVIHIFGLLLYGIAMFIVILKNKHLRIMRKEGGDFMPETKVIVCEIHTNLPDRIIDYIINDGHISGSEKILLLGADIKIQRTSDSMKEVVTRE